MKQIRKISCLLLALIMVLSLGITAFAAGGTATQVLGKGTITVTNINPGETYKLYKVASLEGYDKDKGNYSYKATTEFINILKTDTDIQALLEVSGEGYITWKNPTDVSNTEGAKLAKALAKFIKVQGATLNPVKTETGPATGDIVWDNLDAGYYLVDTTTGALCSLDTTDMTATVKDKNTKPTNNKTAPEAGTGDGWNDAGIGRSVEFKSEIKVYPGIENFIFHDAMSEGLTFDGTDSVTVTVTVPAATESTNTVADPDPFTLYNVVENRTCDKQCDFHIVFSQEFCDAITVPETVVTVKYTATLNENAVVAKKVVKGDGTIDYDVMEGNTNEAMVSFGDDNEFTTGGTTKTFTYEAPIMKYTGSKDTPTALAGAQFELYGAADKTVPIYFSDEGPDEEGVQVYKRIPHKASEAKPANAATIVTPESGKILLQGLDNVPYYLFETVPPEGYNLMTGSTTINVNHGGDLAQNNEPTSIIMVLNNTGNRLPSTGGIGTTIFYVVGSILLIGAGVLLVTKKRMSAQ